MSMLLRSVPDGMRDEIISSRNMCTVNVLFKIYTTYQPGGLRERSMLLGFLTSPGQVASAHEGVLSIRKWFRWLQRTEQIGAALPDVSLLVNGLDVMSQQLLMSLPHVMFRLNIVRTQCALDHNPTLQGLTTYARALQAEFEASAVGNPTQDVSQMSKKQELQAITAANGNGAPQPPSCSQPGRVPERWKGYGSESCWNTSTGSHG